ncbi:MAG: MBL fold metallo-hydrolase [Eubacteriales bacterium]
MTYNIISSGSEGNAVLLSCGILIDCGVSFKKLKDIASHIKLIFLTHEHSDHLKLSTLKRLLEEYPKIKVACSEFLLPKLQELPLKKIRVLPVGALVSWGPFQSQSFPLHHDVPNVGWKIWEKGTSLIYATDTVSMRDVVAKDFDYYLIEGNYKESEIKEKMIRKMRNGEYVYEHRVLQTHLSEEKAIAWLMEMMGEHSRYELIHQHKDRAETVA